MDGVPYNGTIYKINSFIWVKQGDDNALKEVLDKYGPVAVALDASNSEFIQYYNGYFGSSSDSCNNPKLGFNYKYL